MIFQLLACHELVHGPPEEAEKPEKPYPTSRDQDLCAARGDERGIRSRDMPSAPPSTPTSDIHPLLAWHGSDISLPSASSATLNAACEPNDADDKLSSRRWSTASAVSAESAVNAERAKRKKFSAKLNQQASASHPATLHRH